MSLLKDLKLLLLLNKIKNTIMIDRLKSRKLWVAVVSATLVTLGTELGIPPDALSQVVAIVVGYLIGQGAVDAVAALKG